MFFDTTKPLSSNLPLKPGIYRLVNVQSNTALDLSEGDGKTLIGWTRHTNLNQQFIFIPLGHGGGYVIQNAWNGHYATVEDGIGTGISVVGNAFPATWVLEECPQYARGDGGRCFRIRWPNSRFMIDLEGYGCVKDGTRIQLAYEHQPVDPCQVWRFEEVCQASLVSDSQTSPFMYTLDTANESEDEPDDDVSDSFYDAFEDGVMMVVPAQERERKPGHGRVVIETTTTTTITKKMYI